MTDDSSRFLATIQASFQTLFDEEGYHLVEYRHEPKAFGNAIARFENSKYRLTFTCDRGQVFLDIGLAMLPGKSHDLARLVSFLDPASTWSYDVPDEDSLYYNSMEWKVEELERVVEQYKAQLFDSDIFGK